MLNSNIRVDLHIHSEASHYKDGDLVNESKFSNIDILLTKLNENNISLFGFSDHNRFNKELFVKTKKYLDSDKAKTKYPNVKNILPVVEFDVEIDEGYGKCHVLTVFDANSEDELKSIEDVIMNNKLTKQSEYYSRDKFEKIIRDIGQDVILIAAQRKDLENPRKGTNSLSDSVDDVYEFLKVGYINALEVQKSAVEAMIINNLKEFPGRMSFTSGSDCHDWLYYPLHDKNDKAIDKKFYFTIKALPTFTGLVMALTSPESRFDRVEEIEYKHLKSITLNGKEIQLSPGINTIIGENGSGKSTLIYGLLEETNKGNGKYAAKILKKNNFSFLPNNLRGEIHGVRQSEIIENNTKGFIFGREEDYFSSINHMKFDKTIDDFSNTLFNNIENNIETEESKVKLKESNFIFNMDFENERSYYFQIILNKNFTGDTNIHKERLQKINEILFKIKNEYNLKYYSDEHKSVFKNIFNDLMNIRLQVMNEYNERAGIINLKNIIYSSSITYNDDVTKNSGPNDRKLIEYNANKANFFDVILTHINNLNNRKWFDISLGEKVEGKSVNAFRGYNFIKTAKYNEANLLEKFLDKCFNKSYRDLNILKSIKKKDEFVNAIMGAGLDNYKATYKDKVRVFKDELKEEEVYILKAEDNLEVGSTLGEKSLVYYDFLVHNDNKKDILMIDQPEDNISNSKILNNLIDKFANLRDKKQVILVTHNPLLVVNLDSDNIIYLENKNGVIEHKSGCLESDDMLTLVANVMDGGLDAIRRRYKVYGRSKN